ncbi:MAG: TonB-dependent receptor plug domain-containing protein, partial [Myxococcales bacterium]
MWNALLALAVAASAPQPDASPPGTVVTATRLPRPVRDVPATVVVLTGERLRLQPAQTIDGALRTEPSVQMFRRSSSLTADPTAQGLNLRGLGPSGVSRALVLVDGVPANDPFGSWIFWRALPRLGLQQVEIAPGGGSSTYGSQALGGVVNLVSRPLVGRALDATLDLGQRETGALAARAAERVGPVGVAVEGELLTTRGFPVVAPQQRGAVDGDAFSRHANLHARTEWSPAPGARLVARGGFFDQGQNGGTALTSAGVRQASWGVTGALSADGLGELQLDVYGRLLTFTQRRARFGPQRATEALAGEQRVDADDQGALAVWRPPALEALGSHRLAVGADVRRVWGLSRETVLPPAGGTVLRDSGGGQQFAGAFVEDAWSPARDWSVSAAARFDVYRNSDGRRTIGGTVPARETRFDARTGQQLSPRLGVAYRPTGWLTVRASGYRAFRAPTLNELYRPFQVGTVLTAANEGLRAETVLGGEAGVELARGPVVSRLALFWNELRDPITNVTLASPLPDGVTRQRQNLGRARAPGLELAFDWRIVAPLTASAAYTFVDPRVVDAPGRPELLG